MCLAMHVCLQQADSSHTSLRLGNLSCQQKVHVCDVNSVCTGGGCDAALHIWCFAHAQCFTV
jgi:hypothetical protein